LTPPGRFVNILTVTHSIAARGVAAFLAAAVALLAAGPVCGSATDVDAAACCKRHEPCSSTAAGDSAKPDPFRCCIGERSRLTGTLPCADAPAPLDRPLAGDIFEFPPGPLYALTSTYRI
jgi:hypothetical protein